MFYFYSSFFVYANAPFFLSVGEQEVYSPLPEYPAILMHLHL